jgi:O-antigen/teichoic acid export membrane protein
VSRPAAGGGERAAVSADSVAGGGERVAVSAGSVARGVSWVGAGHVVSQVAWFGSLIYVAARLSPAAFGSVTIAMVMVQVAWLVVGSGTRGSFVTAKQLTRAQVHYAILVNVGSGLAVGLTVALFGGWLVAALTPGADVDVLRVLALSIALYGAAVVPLALLQKDLRFKQHAAANAGAALLASALAVVAIALGAGVWALVARQVCFQALLAAFAWAGARGLLPAGDALRRGRRAARPAGGSWFMALAMISFVALNVDFVIVGHVADVAQLGLYALAFTIAFAPMTQFAWQIGKVLFPAAARTGAPAAVGARAAKAVRVTASILLPAAVPALALAPLVLPGLLGEQWEPMVVPFQILVVAGIVHALLAIVREFLLGSGSVAFCVRVEAVWLVATAVALVAGTRAGGIAGAALAHLALVVPLAAAYVLRGAPRIGLSPRAMWRSIAPVAAVVGAQSAALAATVAAVRAAGGGADGAWVAGAAAAGAVAVLGAWRAVRGVRGPRQAVLIAIGLRERVA